MNLEKFMKFVSGQEELNEQAINELKQVVQKYPYFSAAVSLYLLGLKQSDSLSFDNELKKYSIFLTDRKFFMIRLIEQQARQKVQEVKTAEETKAKAKWYDEEVYKNAKAHHDKVMENIIEPKVEKMRKLAKLMPQEHENEQKEQKDEIKATAKDTEKKVVGEISDYQVVVVGSKAKESTEEQKIQASNTEKSKELTEEDIKFEVPTEKLKERGKTENAQDEGGIEIDDIFKKIEELKKQKEKSLHEFEHNVNKIERIVEEQKHREVIAQVQAKNDESQKEDAQAKPQVQEQQQKQESAADTEAHAANNEQPDIMPAVTVEKKEQDKAAQAIKKQTESKEKQEEPKKKSQEDKQTAENEVSQKNESQPVDDKENDKNAEKSAGEPKVRTAVAEDEILKNLEQKAATAVKSEPKTAADRILEQLAKRKSQKKQEHELIDKFLQEQPKIDRKKVKLAPEVDLSEPATKEVEVVTEAMAKIYESQGLYDKAIDVYQKLILKKPEKNSYFAQKIEELKAKQTQNEK